jgi:hypothetical protein
VPCPQLPTGSLSVNTTALRDGPQTVTLIATNAAGTTTTAQSPTVVIDNNGPPAPTALSAAAIAGSTQAVQLTWSDPLNPPQPVAAAQAQLCQGASCSAPVTVSSAGAAQLAVPGPGTYGIRLWLTDSAGEGGPGNAATATVTVPAVAASGPQSSGGGSSKPTTGKTRYPSLRFSHRRQGRTLTLTVRLPKDASGPVTIKLGVLSGVEHKVLLTRHVRDRRGVAALQLTLTAREARAAKLFADASAKHARAISVVLHRT